MTRVLVLGAGGMLGHKVWQRFQLRFETWASVRKDHSVFHDAGLVQEGRLLTGVDAGQLESVEHAIDVARPDVVVNAIGVIKQLETAKDPIASIRTNSLFPHEVAARCRSAGARLVHISTDCVFSGGRGGYTEDDIPDPPDLYGRSKLLGEVDGEGALTLRTSIIGRELASSNGLVEWFLSNRGGRVRGFRKAIFSGLPTTVLADLIGEVIERHPNLNGLFQVAADPIDKDRLLRLVKEGYGVDVQIEPDDSVVIDRSLDGSRFREVTGFVAPPWEELIAAMAADPTPYDQLRSAYADRR